MIKTFCDIYENKESLPQNILYPQLSCPADVRKAYLYVRRVAIVLSCFSNLKNVFVFRKIVKYCHPDKQSNLGEMKFIAPKLFSALTDAYNEFRNVMM